MVQTTQVAGIYTYAMTQFLQKHSGIAWLFLIALAARICFLTLTLHQLPPDTLNTLTPDWSAYTFAAQKLLTNGELTNAPVSTYGPGYPVFLYLICVFTGWAPVLVLVIQCIISAACSIGIYLLAKKLTEDSRIAFVAGLLYALSPLSISLAGALLSETVFTGLTLGAILLFLTGIEKQRYQYFLFSGLLLGAATLTRAQGQYLVILFSLWSLLIWQKQKMISHSVLKTMSFTGLLVVSALGVTGAWIAFNTAVYGLPHVSRAVPGACAKVGTFLASELDGVPWAEKKKELDSVIVVRMKEEKLREQEAYSETAKAYLFSTIRRAPLRSAVWLLRLANTNANFEDGITRFQLPKWSAHIRFAEEWLSRYYLNYRVTVLSLIGMLFLLITKRVKPAILLGSLLLYFAALATFTLWQGGRIMYPAIIAWSILIAVALLGIYDWVRKKSGAFGKAMV